MNRRRTPHFWFPILLLRDALGRFTSVRRPFFSPSKPRRPQRKKTTLLVFVQLELTLA